eukprot:TRINITY_DN32_c0_g1_i4.p1 TRINITY_DN32_c0_g1~~TRINITY_DN32_c0_g1_i4.p1  ORF type:complete len:859 (+),score=230.38 TRINITY_DN32_c0_g1_i4:15-2591(+)
MWERSCHHNISFERKLPHPSSCHPSLLCTYIHKHHTSYYPSMEQLIPVINKLQDVFNTLGTDPLDLPQIVVVGSQSSGKSSVLENVVGRDFLPRGSGIVTRRPLILQLIHLPWDDQTAPSDKVVSPGSSSSSSSSSSGGGGGSGQEWGEFLHKPNEMFYDFNEIREEIVKETDRMTGKNKGISAQPINLKIYSPHVVNLTLVDLPGITKVPVGDQPSDIELQIRRMIMTYIKKPNAIILAVTPANTDLANSDALQLAREVDPDGIRTLGVITKIDLMDKGTDAMDVLTGKVIHLNLGFIGVINRSQEDIQQKKPIRQALKDEVNFFRNHALYKVIANRMGTSYLAKTLNKILMQHIKNCLPELKSRVNKMLLDTQQELLSYGDPLYDTRNSQGALLLQIITQFCACYRDAIDGKLTDLSVHELYGGARINYIFNEVFAQCLNGISPLDGVSQADIRTTIRNATGPRAALFVPEVSFELLVKRQIARLEEPSLQCVELVYDELLRIVAQLENKELSRFVNLRDRVIEVVNGLLSNHRSPTRMMIENLIRIELAFINTNHPDFVGGDGALNSLLENMVQQRQLEQQGPNPFASSGSGASSGFSASHTSASQGAAAQQTTRAPQPGVMASKAPPKPSPASKPAGYVPSSSPPAPGATDGSMQQGGQQQGHGFLNMFFGGGAKPAAAPVPTGYSTSSGSQPSSSSSSASSSSNGIVDATYGAQQQQQQYSNAVGSYNRQAGGAPGDRLTQVPTSIKAGADVTDKERFETELIKSLMVSYFDIVRKNVKDSVPKSIIHFLVNQSKDLIQNELVSNLYKEDLFDELLEESPQISSRRKACKAMLEILRKANDIINDVRDHTFTG